MIRVKKVRFFLFLIALLVLNLIAMSINISNVKEAKRETLKVSQELKEKQEQIAFIRKLMYKYIQYTDIEEMYELEID